MDLAANWRETDRRKSASHLAITTSLRSNFANFCRNDLITRRIRSCSRSFNKPRPPFLQMLAGHLPRLIIYPKSA